MQVNVESWMIQAYEVGVESAGKDLDTWIIKNFHALPAWLDDHDAQAFFMAGRAGLAMPVWRTGWRYGGLPRGDQSWNYSENFAEGGVSIMALTGAVPVKGSGTFLCDRPVVQVAGWYTPANAGSDGEALLVCCVVI